MKVQHLTNNNQLDIQAHPLYQEAVALVRELNKLTEGKALNRGEIHDLFKNAEQAMTAGGGNRTMLGKAGELAGALGNKIKALGQALQDTTVIQGVDAKFDELKQAASAKLGKSPEGSKVLRVIDTYKQTVQRYPATSKFFWGVAGVLTGLLTSGAAPVLMLGAAKMIDGLLQNEQLSTAAGRAVRPMGMAMGAKALAGAGKAIANTDIPDINNPFKPDNVNPPGPDNVNPPGPDNVVPPKPAPGPDNVVPPGGETQTITVKSGDTMSGIADKYKVNPDELAKLNPGKFGPQGNPNILNPGDQIVLPKNIDAAAYKGAYQGDNAMTAQNIANKVASKQYGTDQGMSAARVAKDAAAAAAKSGKAVATESVKITKGRGVLEGFNIISLPTRQLIDREQTVRKWALNESLGRARPSSVQLTEQGVRTLFMNLENLYEFAVDEARRNNYGRELRNQVGQAAGRTGRTGQQFVKDFPAAYNAMKTGSGQPAPQYTAADPENQEGGTVFSRPANANDPAAMAKNAATAATNTSSTAGPQGKLPGGPLTAPADGKVEPSMDGSKKLPPAGNTMPYLAADPEGKFKTKGKGPLGGKLMRGIEGGLRRFGNWAGDTWREATTKVTLNGLLRHWQDAGSPTDSDEVAQILLRKKVPNEIIQQLYQQLNFPAPKLPSTAAPAASTAPGAATDAGAAGGAGTDDYQRDEKGNVRFFANGTPAMNQTVGSTDAMSTPGADLANFTDEQLRSGLDQMLRQNDPADQQIIQRVQQELARRQGGGRGQQQGGGMGGQMGGGMGGGMGGQMGGGMGGDGQIASATSMILPQLARMTGPAYADDLITIIDTALSVLQRSAPTAYREKMAQFRGTSAGKQREKATDIIQRTKTKKSKGQGGAEQPVPSKPLGPSRVAANNPGAPTPAEREKFDQRVAQASGQANEEDFVKASNELARYAGQQANEQTRVYGGKYIRESADAKLAREFENFVLDAFKS